MAFAPLRSLQRGLFGLAGGPADKMSLHMLVLSRRAQYFELHRGAPVAGRAATLASDGGKRRSAERGARCRRLRRRRTGALAGRGAAGLDGLAVKVDPVSSVLTTFLGVCLLRKLFWTRCATRAPQS
jgi:hypothetical protein